MSRYIALPRNLLWVGLLAAAIGRATLIPSLDLEALVNEADTIAVGRAIAITRQGQTMTGNANGTLMRVDLEIEKTIKGRPRGQHITFQFVSPGAPIGYQGIREGQFGVFFLRNTQAGYKLVSPYYPLLVLLCYKT